jgi:hypothetical protein
MESEQSNSSTLLQDGISLHFLFRKREGENIETRKEKNDMLFSPFCCVLNLYSLCSYKKVTIRLIKRKNVWKRIWRGKRERKREI